MKRKNQNPRRRETGASRRDTSPAVQVTITELILPTYLPGAPERNPMFLEKRVYQGSSGRVYPLPFTDRIAEQPVDRKWKAIRIENEFLQAVVLPEIGGRIHSLRDKTNGYDLVYKPTVIKPALVGLAGPWISGGIEFNWPQHHRPATFLPVDFEIEKRADGSVTVWCGDHEPMNRLKGMHGICLRPGRACLEVKVRAYNRTPYVQTFHWWANVATRVHEAYQSFFPTDVYYVADHARRSTSEFPLAKGFYYGVNYGARERSGIPPGEVPPRYVPPHCASADGQPAFNPALAYAPNDLSFYANIPVPTSYMCMGSQADFFGGYDHQAQAGIVHVANHHISPGKKQWTWGNHPFGYAWDRNLTDADARGEHRPYIELMAGVYTDNQPDFSFLQPGETKTWSQYWYPIQQIGVARQANWDAALSLQVVDGALRGADRRLRAGVAVTRALPGARLVITAQAKPILTTEIDLAPGRPWVQEVKIPRDLAETELVFRVTDATGKEIISFQPQPAIQKAVPPPASEPPAPASISSADELYVTGLHLEQYRHATRCPSLYWREALRRDPLDARCNLALGRWHFKRGELAAAEVLFRKAIERLTRRNGNPYDGEPLYCLGLCLRHLGRDAEAYDALYKSAWNQAWAGAAYHALAEIDAGRGQWSLALDHLDRALRLDTDNLRARNLRVIALRKLGRSSEAEANLAATRQLDPLDSWARLLAGENPGGDWQTRLDLAHDHARAGLFHEAIQVLAGAPASDDNGELLNQNWGALPMVHYTSGWLEQKRGEPDAARERFRQAAALPPDYCFPARLEEIAILEAAIQANPRDARAPYYLGNLLYDRRRHEEAIRFWENSVKLDPAFSVAWRNLGIGYFNIRKQPGKARAAYERAFRANPNDARLLYERDQLGKRLGARPADRLRELEKHPGLVARRDDLSLELCALYNQTGQAEQALELLSRRHFQPWEGGEGGPLGQWTRARLALGRAEMNSSKGHAAAIAHFQAALSTPQNLGEAAHLLANQSDIHYWLGCACSAAGDTTAARRHWLAAANFKGDFQEMSVRAYSELTYYSAKSLEKLGQAAQAKKLFRELLAYAQTLQRSQAKIDYFATSLPTMLLFEDDLQSRQETTALFLQAQARLGLDDRAAGRRLLTRVLERDPNHPMAADLIAQLNPAAAPATTPKTPRRTKLRSPRIPARTTARL